MYSTDWCSDCRNAKRFLEENNVDYTEVNIEKNEDAAQTVIKHTGGKRIVPTFDIDGKLYSNPNFRDLKEILNIS